MILKNGKRIDGCTDTLPVGTVQPFLGLTPPLGYLVCQGQLISKVEYPELYKICGSTFGTETSTHFYLPDLRGKTIAGYDSNDSTMNTIGKLLGQKIHTHTSAAHTHSVAGHTHTSAAHSHSSAAHSHSTGNHTLTIAEIPAHQHMVQTFPYKGSDGSYYCISPTPGYQVDPGTHWRGGFADYTGGSGAHNHGNTGSTTPGNTGSTTPGATGSTSLTTDSTTPNATGSNTNFQPTVIMNWIVKAAMLIPEYFIVENTLTSTSTSNALSAAQGKILSNSVNELQTSVNNIKTQITHDFMVLGFSGAESTWTEDGVWIPVGFGAVKSSSGNKLINSMPNVKIGKGVSKVRVFAQLTYYQESTDDYMFLAITKNGVNQAKSIQAMAAWGQITVDYVLSVKEGDLIGAQVYKDNDGVRVDLQDFTSFTNAPCNYLLVEVIE